MKAADHLVWCNQVVAKTYHDDVMSVDGCPCTADAIERRRSQLKFGTALDELTDDELAARCATLFELFNSDCRIAFGRSTGGPLFAVVKDAMGDYHKEAHRRIGVTDGYTDQWCHADSIYRRAWSDFRIGMGGEPFEPKPCKCNSPKEETR